MLQNTVSGHFTDLWALGCIIYEMNYGEVPFRGTTDLETFDIILKGGIDWPETPDPQLQDVVQRLLNLEPMQ